MLRARDIRDRLKGTGTNPVLMRILEALAEDNMKMREQLYEVAVTVDRLVDSLDVIISSIQSQPPGSKPSRVALVDKVRSKELPDGVSVDSEPPGTD